MKRRLRWFSRRFWNFGGPRVSPAGPARLSVEERVRALRGQGEDAQVRACLEVLAELEQDWAAGRMRSGIAAEDRAFVNGAEMALAVARDELLWYVGGADLGGGPADGRDAEG